MRATKLGLALPTVAALFVASCGTKSSKPVELPDPRYTQIDGTAALDGYVLSDGTFFASGGTPCTGDLDGDTNGLGARQFFCFDLSTIPPGSTIVRADFFINHLDRVGTPWPSHGAVLIEHVDYGDALDGSDYDTPALGPASGIASTDPFSTFVTVWTSEVQADLDAGRTHSQFRTRCESFDSDSDGVSDYLLFTDAESSATGGGFKPYLSVGYRAP